MTPKRVRKPHTCVMARGRPMLVQERIKTLQGSDDHMLAELHQRGWTNFICALEAAVIKIVKEFHSMLKATERDKADYRVQFQGVNLELLWPVEELGFVLDADGLIFQAVGRTTWKI